MYALYNKKAEADSSRFEQVKRISLFGCNVGLIPKFLARITHEEQAEPYR